MGGRDAPPRRSTSVAGWALLVVGCANALLGIAGLTAASDDVGPGVAAGLLGAGAATVAAGWLVRRGSRRTLYVALAVFEALLVVRVLTLTGGGEGAGISLAVLVGLVAALVVAAIDVRRADRAGHQPP